MNSSSTVHSLTHPHKNRNAKNLARKEKTQSKITKASPTLTQNSIPTFLMIMLYSIACQTILMNWRIFWATLSTRSNNTKLSSWSNRKNWKVIDQFYAKTRNRMWATTPSRYAQTSPSSTLTNWSRNSLKSRKVTSMWSWWIPHGNFPVHNLQEALPFSMTVSVMSILKRSQSQSCRKMEVCWSSGPSMLSTPLRSILWKKSGATKLWTQSPGLKRPSMVRLPKGTDFTCNMQSKRVWLELKDNLRNLWKEEWPKMLFSAKEEVRVKSRPKFMSTSRVWYRMDPTYKFSEEETT